MDSAIKKYRYMLLAVLALIAIGLTAGIPNLSFNTDYHAFYDDGNPELRAFDTIQDRFVKSDTVMIMVSPEDGQVFTPSTISAIHALTERSWQIPYSTRVDSITNFQFSEAEGDDLTVRDLVPSDQPLSSRFLKEANQDALAQAELVGRLLSSDSAHTALYITISFPDERKPGQPKEVMEAVRTMISSIESDHSDLAFHVSGVVPMDYAFAEVSMRDGETLITGALLLMLVILYALFRSVAAVLATTSIILGAVLMALGTAGWIGIQLTPPSASAPLMILTIAIADCIHFISSYQYKLQTTRIKWKAIRYAYSNNWMPILLTSVTSAIGFLGMNFSDSPPFRDLGNITALGIVFAGVLSLTVLPALLWFLPPVTGQGITLRSADRLLNRLAATVTAKPLVIAAVGLCVVVTLIAQLPKNRIDDTFLHYFDNSIQFRADSDEIERRLTGLYFIDYAIDSGSENGVYDPGYLKKVEDFVDWLNVQPEVTHVSSLVSTVKRLNKNLHGDDPLHARLPDTEQEIAQYIFLYEMSLPYGLDLKNQMSLDKSSLRVSATLSTIPTQQVLAFEKRAKTWWEQHDGISVLAGSPTLMFAHISLRNIQSMLTGTALALIGISMLMLLMMRSLKYGMISLLPNLAPALMAFGLWGLAVGEVGLAVSVVAAMSLGIVVDDTIHFLYRCLRHQRAGTDINQAVSLSIRHVGRAIVSTSLILAGGFGILALSHFKVNSEMGLLTAVCILIALVLDLVLLPALLVLTFRKKHDASTVPAAAQPQSA
ncbi:MMPL family transporter [Microbulbifer elongatus]|uniref:MMPL family transporter n=1 Tax=Microbulbifer elongatus TaxID=86173 RepID=A0ABT1P3M1_9GAMM|nr:MMPL family transporter [Microbulbifer elongatus]MCQ3830709.1 MMPL family transporter [Microbulbifer elongatus]